MYRMAAVKRLEEVRRVVYQRRVILLWWRWTFDIWGESHVVWWKRRGRVIKGLLCCRALLKEREGSVGFCSVHLNSS